MKGKIGILALLFLIIFTFNIGTALAGDPTGTNLSGKATYENLYANQSFKEAVGKNALSINFIWVLLAAFLVLFMQAGFAMVEVGFTRALNAAHVVMTNFVIFSIGVLGFWAVGFALMFGGAGGIASLGGLAPLNGLFEIVKGWGVFGTKGFFLSGDAYDVAVFLLFLFQVAFMDTMATIPTGALAERWKWSAFCVYGLFVSTILYPIFGNWVWGGGWLAKLGVNLHLGHGYIDFAGSSVVHAVGGLTALVGAYILGPRIGKFNKDGSPNAMPGHNIPLAILGTFILLFGWFGFNAGSTLAATDLRISVIAVNTMLASAAGSLASMFLVWILFGKPDPSMTANGMLAGLVAITAPCAFVPAWAAVLIGAIGGLLVVVGVLFVEHKLKIDDPVGAISVHGFNGLWGVISLGIFADGTYGAGWNGVNGTVRGLLFGDPTQLLAQLIGAGVCLLYTLTLSYLFFKVQDSLVGIRVSEREELLGLDIPEMGSLAYHGFVTSKFESRRETA